MAAIGGMLAARRAGEIAATSVTSVPMASETQMVRGRSCRDDEGRSIPNAFSSAVRPMAMRIPTPSPIAPASTPTMAASASTEVVICRPVAPRARSNPSSRVRWATMIENVLKMMNVPTNSAIPAKTSSAVRMKPSPSLTWLAASSAACVAVTASTPCGRTDCTRVRRTEAETPSSATTSMVSNWPSAPSTRCAVAVSNATSVAPPRLSALPNPSRPVIVNCSGGPWNRIVMRSPTWRSALLAVETSTPTSPACCGGFPSRSDSGFSGASIQFSPNVGAPPVVTGSPFLSTTWA